MPDMSSSNKSSHSHTHTRSFSLEAFQNLISRRASLLTRFSNPRAKKFRSKCYHPALNTDLFFPRLQEGDDNLSPATVVSVKEMRPRSIITESDTSDDEYTGLRDDEGWIPIILDESPASPSPMDPYYPIRCRRGSHTRSGSIRSESSISSFESESIFSAEGEEWTPPMTPMSAYFGERTSLKGDKGNKHVSMSTEYYVEENMNWIFEVACREESW